MATARLTINLCALQRNWQALAAFSADATETAAVVKADGYGLDAARVSDALNAVGVQSFFVATAEEGAVVRKALSSVTIYVFSGYMENDAAIYAANNLIPLLNSPKQLQAWQSDMGNQPFALQLDTGMNRLGFEPDEFSEVTTTARLSKLLISHLACSEQPQHPQNEQQLRCFREMTDSLAAGGVPRSLAATGGTLLGKDYHFDMVRPGIGLYGGLPFAKAEPVVTLSLPVIQTRTVKTGETVGYGGCWQASRETTVATLSAGYADGIIRAIGEQTTGKSVSLYSGTTPCPQIGRVSMDLLTVDISALQETPTELELINPLQGVDVLAAAAGTIGYEILTALGGRYKRVYTNNDKGVIAKFDNAGRGVQPVSVGENIESPG